MVITIDTENINVFPLPEERIPENSQMVKEMA